MTFPGEFTCKELVELVTDYFEGALPAEERLRVDEHLVTCAGCRDYLDQMRVTIRSAGELREEDLEPEVRDRLLAAFRDWRTA